MSAGRQPTACVASRSTSRAPRTRNSRETRARTVSKVLRVCPRRPIAWTVLTSRSVAGMVVFICEACNETLKRNKVASHWCRNFWYLSCMDCNKRFEGDEYLSHTTCVSEAERYQGALYVHKDNKGEVKQQAWMSSVQKRLDEADGSAKLRPFMERLLAYDNVPRKRTKFINFAKNSLNLKQDRDGIAEKLWEVIGAAEGNGAPSGQADGAEAPEAAQAAAEKAAAEKAAALESLRGEQRDVLVVL